MKILKSPKLGKPYSQQPGRRFGIGRGYIKDLPYREGWMNRLNIDSEEALQIHRQINHDSFTNAKVAIGRMANRVEASIEKYFLKQSKTIPISIKKQLDDLNTLIYGNFEGTK